MIVTFNNKEYKKNARHGLGLKYLCFDIFKQYLNLNNSLSYENLKNIFNQWHCNNNFVVLSKIEWENKPDNLKARYFNPISYNSEEIYFTTQWGNNGGNCDNINNMIDFAIRQGYAIKVINEGSKTIGTHNIKNIILYGAPGVGKTHNYKKLIALLDNPKYSVPEVFKFIQNEEAYNFTDIEAGYSIIKDEKRFEFITFHQNYSYEDFIEGFRPNEDDNKIIRKDGVFKILSDKASKNLSNSKKNITEMTQVLEFEQLFDEFKDVIQDEIDKNKKYIINETAYITNIEKDAFRYTGDSWGNTQRMKFLDIELLYNLEIKERKEIKKLEQISGLARQHATYFTYLIKKFYEFKKTRTISVPRVSREEQKNFYLIIDEINRGNISKIFGELITLIEEDKRDTYEVTLPYSKEKFKIPSNLYIIATMNSTDKSIATIDIALRRRFTFLKMKPSLGLVTNLEARDLMDKLNVYITEKLGEDYMLGHSYFMGKDIDLEFIVEYKIKPLLEEYFYAEEITPDKIIKQVLGSH